MIRYIKEYPFSLLIIAIVAYLSLMKPPSLGIPLFAGLDKFVHFCMYGGVSGVLWVEYLFNHRKGKLDIKYALTGAVICPILFGGFIELCQRYLTSNRSGDWLDFLANTGGVITATLIAWYILRPLIIKKTCS